MMSRRRRSLQRSPRGFVLIALIALLAMGVLYFVTVQLEAASLYQREARQGGGGDSLVQAREALLGYAATYRDDPAHPDEVFGYLPCPDLDGSGQAASVCGTAGEASVGLLPYKTLGLPDLRDRTGFCLWYAVSGNFKNNPKGTSAAVPVPLHWDTQGQFTVQDAAGITLVAPSDVQGGAAAVIFAPGPSLGQGRSVGGQAPCYIDQTQIAGYLDGNYDSASGATTAYNFATSGPITLTQGPVLDASNSTKNNDRLAWVAPREIFDKVVRRADFSNPLASSPAGHINKLSNEVKATWEKKIQDDLLAGTNTNSQPANVASFTQFAGKQIGTLPTALTLNDASYSKYYDNWSGQYRQALCSNLATPCLTVAGTACRGALMFGGRNADGTPRTSAQQAYSTANLDYYFETGSGREILNSATTAFSGLTAYTENGTAAGRALDVGTCVFPGDFKSFAQNIADFASGLASATPSDPQVIVSTAAKTITLYAVNDASRSGCDWSSTPMQLSSLLRVYFRFQLVQKGQGFTFTIADATTNSPTATNPPMCGNTGTRLGYAGPPPGYSTAGIMPPKIGLEFDLMSNTSSLTRNDPSGDHIAFVYWGARSDNVVWPYSGNDDIDHGGGTTDSATEPRNSRVLTNSTANGMSWSSGTVTVTTGANHELWTGQTVTISGASPSTYNGTFAVSVVSATQFTYSLSTDPGVWTSGGSVSTARGIATVNSSDPYLLSTSGELPTTTATVPYTGSSPQDTVIHVRLDITKSYDGSSTGIYNLTAYVGDRFSVYDSTLGTYSTCTIDDFQNLSRNLSELCNQTPKVQQSNVRIQNISGEAFQTAYIGFTTSRSSLASDDQNIVISNLQARSQ